jgi:PKD repeat protein/GH35 family endo-1,4-beta-xylanase
MSIHGGKVYALTSATCALAAFVAVSAISDQAHAQQPRPNLYGCGITWGQWQQLNDADAKEFDRRSMDKIVEMGGTNCPANFAWIDIEPTRGVYNWDYVDHQVAEAEARGLEIFAYVGLTPDWALPPGILDQYGSGAGYRFPPDEQYIPDFEAFLSTLATRYAGRVKYYQFWNEPNGCSWINDGCANGHMAHTYVPWLIRCYNAMKAADPNCVIAVGGLDYNETATNAYTYIQDIYAAGGGDYFDAVGIHPYGYTQALNWIAIWDTYQVLVNHGDGHKKLWVNEYGWHTSDENAKAAQLTEVLTELKKPEYHMVFQANHLIITDLPGTPDWGHDYGLCSRDMSTLTITPRQSWYAFQALDKSWPEVADFEVDVRTGEAPLTVNFQDISYVPDAYEWAWDFGDGQTSQQQHPTHTYTEPGWYSVTLAVTGVSGTEIFTQENLIRVGDLPQVAFIVGGLPLSQADAAVMDHLEALGVVVTPFDDEPQNRPSAATLAADYDLIVGSSTLLSANVGGDFRNETVPFVFWEPALAWDGRESMADTPVAVPDQSQLEILDNTHPVTAGLPQGPVTVTDETTSFSYCTGTVASGVTTLATSTGTPTDVAVLVADPGAQLLDGGVAEGTRISLYLYDDTWLVANSYGKQILTNAVEYTLGTVEAQFSATPTTGLSPVTVTFDDLSTGPVGGWEWDFGDGTTSKLQSPTHTYEAGGTYDVSLTVFGPGGPSTVSMPELINVVQSVPADFDLDGDVDQVDFGHLQACLSGDSVINTDPNCANANISPSVGIGADDFSAFYECFSGTDVPADPACMN